MSCQSSAVKILDNLDQEKSFKTQIIVGLGAFIITTFFLFWVGAKQEGLIAGDMAALALGAAYITYLDRTKIAYTNRLSGGLIIIAVIRAAVAMTVTGVMA